MTNKILFIDTETTGVSPNSGIWQIAGAIYIDGELKEKFKWECAPFISDAIEEKAIEMSGKTIGELRLLTSPITAYVEFGDMLAKYVDKFDKQDKFFFVGYNANFDMQMMRSWFFKCKDKYFGSWFWFPPLDVMQLAAWNNISCRHSFIDFKLGTVCDKYGINLEGEESLHQADTDIRVTIELADKLVKQMGLKLM